jgi:cell division protein WhiA
MSFSAKTKNELSRLISPKKCCNIAELSAIVKLSGSLQLAGNKKINLKITTEHNSIARKIFKLLKLNFGINTKISVNKNKTLKKSTSYVLLVTSDMGAINLLKDLGILCSEEAFYTINTVPANLIKDENCARSFIRGAFLGGGSISDPEKNYHLEIVASNEEFAESLKELINSLGFNSKIVIRKNNYVVYLKESEQISDLLSIIGAHNALLSLQNVKIVKEMRNNVNRIVNCETANLSKTVSAAVRQIDNIKYIRDTKGLDYIPRNLREIANLRIEYEDLTLKELGEMLNPPVGKSGVNHRLRKIEQIAEDLREKNEYK